MNRSLLPFLHLSWLVQLLDQADATQYLYFTVFLSLPSLFPTVLDLVPFSASLLTPSR